MENRCQSNLAEKQKMRRDVKLLYDVMADTIGYIQVQMSVASLQLARIHARNEIINALRSALREE